MEIKYTESNFLFSHYKKRRQVVVPFHLSLLQFTMQVTNNSTRWTPESKAGSAMFGISMILGIPGNVAVVVIILTQVKKKSYTLQLILNLAVSDIICLLTMPLWINNHLNGWSLGKLTCRLFVILLYVSVVSNLLTVMLMSVHRYVYVLYPRRWSKLGRRGEMALLICLWALAFVFSGPYSVIYKAEENECEIIISSGLDRLLVLCSETLLCFIVPFLTMLIFYLRLHKKVNQKTFFRHSRMTKMVICILVSFFVVWCPYHIFNLVEIVAIMLKFSYQHASEKVLDVVHDHRLIVEGFASFNTCVNPYLYAFSFLRPGKPKQPEQENNVTKCSTEM